MKTTSLSIILRHLKLLLKFLKPEPTTDQLSNIVFVGCILMILSAFIKLIIL